jgi:hypothetical protein
MRRQNVILLKPNLALFSSATPDTAKKNPVAPGMLVDVPWRVSRRQGDAIVEKSQRNRSNGGVRPACSER